MAKVWPAIKNAQGPVEHAERHLQAVVDGDAASLAAVPAAAVSNPVSLDSLSRDRPRKIVLLRGAALSRKTRERVRPILLGVLSLVLFILTWHFATKYRLDLYIRFQNIPSPLTVYEHASQLFGTDQFYSNMLISLRRILIGFGIAAVLGIALGLLIGRYRLVRELALPPLEVLRPIPAIAWVPMSIMLWPTSETSIVFITFLGSFFPILLNTIHGVQTLDSVYVRAAQCLGAGEAALFREVILPGALPQIFTGLSVGMGVAWVSLIAAEMISGQFGIGYFTWEAYSLIQYADIAIGMIVIGILGLMCSGAIRLFARLLIRWQA